MHVRIADVVGDAAIVEYWRNRKLDGGNARI